MMLNSDLYEDLAAELILSEEGRQKFMTEFMLSGKGLLSALRRVTKKMKCVCFFWEECHSNPSCSPYLVTLKLDDREGISMDLDHPDMLKIIHWTLSSVRRVRINCDKPLPGNVVELLLNNPNFTELELNLYDFPTAKLLIESRRFEFIEVDFGMSDDLNRIRIDTEKLEFHNASLRDILRMQSINVTSLCATYSYEGFDDSILTMNLSPGFESLEKLEIILECYCPIIFNPMEVPKLLEFFNTRFINLKCIVLFFHEHHSDMHYNSGDECFETPPSAFTEFVNYKNKLGVYNGRARVELHHLAHFRLIPHHMENIEKYLEELKKELRDYRYSSEDDVDDIRYNFQKSSKIAENFELNNDFWFYYWKGD